MEIWIVELALGLSVIVALVLQFSGRPVLDVAPSEGHHETDKWSALQVVRLLA